MVRRLVDVSHPIAAGMITYPGLPGPKVTDYLSREESKSRYGPGTSFQIGRIEMITNTGTYLDAPFHRLEEGADIAGLPLERLADLPGIVVEARERAGRALGPEIFGEGELSGRAVLVRTGWSRHWATEAYGEGHPYLDRGASQLLVDRGAALVGIDTLNIDDTRDGARPAHTLLLSAGIPIVEHLCNLEALPGSGFRFHCAPAPFRGAGSFPVRAYAVLEG
ncbi:MAG: cyclase family protein [Thermoanaerobaculia bacterium]